MRIKKLSGVVFKKENSIFVSFFLGVIIFLFIYGLEPLRYTGVGWMVNGFGGSDITQHQTGWEFYRHSPWTFPLCKALYLGYPAGTAISYTDSIPVVALLFKLISPLLPETFQYFGLYTCFCFGLQGLFAAALLRRFTKYELFSIVGSVSFVTASCFLERCFRHTALSSHWLLLVAMLLYFKRKQNPLFKHRYMCWAFLLCLAIGIHPYLFAMCFGVFVVFSIEDIFSGIERKSGVIKFAAVVFTAILFGFALGLFGSDVESAHGFGIYSLNLNAVFNPYTRHFVQWSSAVEDRPIYGGQTDGIYYVGLFMNVVFVLSVFIFLLSGSQNIRRILKKYAFFIVLLAVYTVFALSNTVTFDDHVIFRYFLPEFFVDKVNIFRASGRFFFIPYYSIFLFSLVILYRVMYGKWVAVISAAVLVLIQTMEINPGIKELRAYFAERKEPLYFSNDWNELAQNYEIAMTFDCLTDRTLAFWLAQKDFRTNMMITAPVHMNAYWENTKEYRNRLKDGLEQGTWELDKDTIYLISEDTGQNCTFRDETELMSYINTVKENYRNSAGVIYLTDWIKNYWIIVPHQ